MDSQESGHQTNNGRIFIGLVILLIGFAMLGERTGFYGLHVPGRFWPMILVVLGAIKVLDPGRRGRHQGSRRGGAWLMYVGCWLLVNEFNLFGFDYSTSWPLLIIGAGILMVWRAFERPDGGCNRVRES
jgi:hypothetical protein